MEDEESSTKLAIFVPLDKEKVKSQIYEIRGFRVMLDSDIAAYFGTTTGNLNKAKKRNQDRFPEHFAFTLTAEEVSIFQSGISMQTKGVKGGRSKVPTVYTEQGIAMLTSCLHTPQAITASIQIMEAFVEMTHYLQQSRQLLPYMEMQRLSDRQNVVETDVKAIKDTMITKDDLSDLMKLFNNGLKEEEILILDGQPFKADLAYQKIYKKAKKNIIVIDDYLGIKTLHHLAAAKKNVKITIISDNKGSHPLRKDEYNDFQKEYSDRDITFIKSDDKMHDRYIVLDYGTVAIKVYHCGASSKDAGRRITTITEIRDVSDYKKTVKDLLSNEQLVMK